MQTSKLNTLCILIICLSLAACAFSFPPMGDTLPYQGKESDHVDGRTIRITDQSGKLVTMTARDVNIGDEIILPSGDHYRVTQVKGNKAGAELIGQDNDYLAWVDYFDNNAVAVTAVSGIDRPVGVYHTHSDESYLPTDGKSSIPFHGGIYQVGEEFVQALRANGLKVNYYKTPHDPHDSNAYERSRRTAMGLLRTNPIAVFDIHRDGVPDPEFYKKNVSGESIAQLKLVIGQQNPKMETNMDFARRIMAYANEKHPGVVKEIYKAQGNYNQDLLSTNILLEAGTYTNEKPTAQIGIKLLAEAIPVVLGVNNPGGGVTSEEASETGWNVALWLIGITLAAGLLFVVINNGWQGTLERMRQIGQGLVNGDVWAKVKETGQRLASGDALAKMKETGERMVNSDVWTRVRESVQRTIGDVRARVMQAGPRGKDFIQGSLVDNVRSVRDKIKDAVQRKNKI